MESGHLLAHTTQSGVERSRLDMKSTPRGGLNALWHQRGDHDGNLDAAHWSWHDREGRELIILARPGDFFARQEGQKDLQRLIKSLSGLRDGLVHASHLVG